MHWTHTALEHLVAIFERIERDSPSYARQVVDRLIWRLEQVATYPLAGRVVPEYDSQHIREVLEGPYRLIYPVKEDQIDVLALVHGAQLLPTELQQR